MSEEEVKLHVFIVYEPENGSESGIYVGAESADEAASFYCDIQECTNPCVTVRCVNQDTNEWEDVKLYRVWCESEKDWSVN